MIQYFKRINVYFYTISDIYCCDCVFNRILGLLESSEEFSKPDEFIDILENEFSRNFVILHFGEKIVLFCRKLIKFIIKIKKQREKIRMNSCITDFISDGDKTIEVCPVCFIKIIDNNKLFHRFKRNLESLRNETDYFFL